MKKLTDEMTLLKHFLVVRKVRFPVYVDSYGIFFVILDPELEADHISARTLRELEVQLEEILKERAKNIRLPVCRLVDRAVQHGHVHGIHAANRDILVTWSDGEKTRETASSLYEDINEEVERAITGAMEEMRVAQLRLKEAKKDLVCLSYQTINDRLVAALAKKSQE